CFQPDVVVLVWFVFVILTPHSKCRETSAGRHYRCTRARGLLRVYDSGVLRSASGISPDSGWYAPPPILPAWACRAQELPPQSFSSARAYMTDSPFRAGERGACDPVGRQGNRGMAHGIPGGPDRREPVPTSAAGRASTEDAAAAVARWGPPVLDPCLSMD